jgi:subtilase family serine protease
VTNPPATGSIGGSVAVGAQAQNFGTITSGATTVGFYLSTDGTRGSDDRLMGSLALGSLAGGGSASVSGSLTIPAGVAPGTYLVLACADYPTTQVIETDESNNCLASAGSIVVAAGPDLVVAALDDPPAQATVGTAISLSDTTSNTGAELAGASTTRFYLSLDTVLSGTDPLLGSRSVASLAGGASHTFAGSYTIPVGTGGTYFVLACADRLNAVLESNETNNCRASTTTVNVVGPNLRVASLTPTPSPAVQGQAFTLDATVDNAGTAAAAASNVYYWLSTDAVKGTGDTVLTTGAAASVGAGASVQSLRTIIFPTTVAAGSYFLIPCADGGNLVPETDERDNCGAAVALTVTAAP